MCFDSDPRLVVPFSAIQCALVVTGFCRKKRDSGIRQCLT